MTTARKHRISKRTQLSNKVTVVISDGVRSRRRAVRRPIRRLPRPESVREPVREPVRTSIYLQPPIYTQQHYNNREGEVIKDLVTSLLKERIKPVEPTEVVETAKTPRDSSRGTPTRKTPKKLSLFSSLRKKTPKHPLTKKEEEKPTLLDFSVNLGTPMASASAGEPKKGVLSFFSSGQKKKDNNPATSPLAQTNLYLAPVKVSLRTEHAILASGLESSLREYTPDNLRRIYREFTTKSMPSRLQNRDEMVDNYFNVNDLSTERLTHLREILDGYTVPENPSGVTARRI